jgi:plastocyanin
VSGSRSAPQRLGTVLAGAVLVGSATAAAPVAEPGSHTVTIENMQFTPAHVSVHRGDRIVWVNKDLFPHTVTADDKAFDSGPIDAGSSWTHVAAKAGEYAYSCTLHPTMKATLTVK